MSSIIKPVVLRKNDGEKRGSTWLELFFDLSYVIIVAKLTSALAENPSWSGLGIYVLIFIPIWWVWNQFSVYSNQFDNGDYISKILFILGIFVSLHMASSFPEMLDRDMNDFVHSYLSLHIILLTLWLRTVKHNKKYIGAIKRRIFELLMVAIALVVSLFFEFETQRAMWIGIIIFQLLSPFYDYFVKKDFIPIVRGHLVERFGLFTIILLGESLLTVVVILEKHPTDIIYVVAFGFFITVLLWWIYFEWDFEEANIKGPGSFFIFNYLHFFVFVALGGFAEALELSFEAALDHHVLSDMGQDLMIGSIALFILSIQLIYLFTNRLTQKETFFTWPIIVLLIVLIFANNSFTLFSTLLIVTALLLILIAVRYLFIKRQRNKSQ